MDSMVTPSVHGAGFATVGRGADGPYWSAFGASEAALATYGGIQTSDVYGGIQSHFVRDAVERNAHTVDIRAELRDLRDTRFNRRDVPATDPELAILRSEVARLRDEKLDAQNKSILDALAAIKKVTV